MTPAHALCDLLAHRFSCRAFLPTPVEAHTVRAILADAAHVANGGNLQPWRVIGVAGPALEAVKAAGLAAIEADPFGDESVYPSYPKGLKEPYRSRRSALGEAMYATLGIAREDKPARLTWLLNNYRFFGAPAALFFALDKDFDRPQWAHLGMFMGACDLAAQARGLATCFQEAWHARQATVAATLNLDETLQLYCAMALGHADPDAPVNTLKAGRVSVDEFAELRGF